MKKYCLVMKNPKSGKLEAYTTEVGNQQELQMFLDFWQNDAGYTIISAEEIKEEA